MKDILRAHEAMDLEFLGQSGALSTELSEATFPASECSAPQGLKHETSVGMNTTY